MQPSIHLLSDETINQIAAGEVIESPASVVKELVENALDASAKKIVIDITGGGLKRICVEDDGKGMHELDAIASIKRHATSKITRPQDLFRITTKGFRGEALASIGSISKMTISTAQEGGVGTELEIEKGEIVKKRVCARQRGTSIEVLSLFYSVPARKKFQKSPAALSAEIFRMVTLMSLSHPEVGFTLHSNGRKAFAAIGKAGTLFEMAKERATESLGTEFTEGCFPLEFEEGAFSFVGLLGSPTKSRPNKMGQYLFLNGRAVSCPSIEEAISRGYATRVEEKRHPLFLLHLKIPPDLVDVNVHPQKLQVRLRKEELVQNMLETATSKALTPKRAPLKAPASTASFLPPACPIESEPLQEALLFEEQELILENEAECVGIFDHYLILRASSVEPDLDGLILVNLHAAQERLLFESLTSSQTKQSHSQGLLVPFSIDITNVEEAMILTHKDAIERLGLSFSAIGKNTLLIEAIPPLVKEEEVKSLISEMTEDLKQLIGQGGYEKKRQEVLALRMVAHLRKKPSFLKPEAMLLFGKLKKCQDPYHCPRGQPTTVHIHDESIQDFFSKNQSIAKSLAQRS